MLRLKDREARNGIEVQGAEEVHETVCQGKARLVVSARYVLEVTSEHWFCPSPIRHRRNHPASPPNTASVSSSTAKSSTASTAYEPKHGYLDDLNHHILHASAAASSSSSATASSGGWVNLGFLGPVCSVVIKVRDRGGVGGCDYSVRGGVNYCWSCECDGGAINS